MVPLHLTHLTRIRAARHALVTRCRYIGHCMFGRYLLLTNVCISISLSGVGDTIEQHYEIATKQKDKWDRVRTAHMSFTGMTIGVICHNWYRFLDKRIPGRSLQDVLRKVLIDQVVCSPLCIATFFITLGALEKSSWSDIKKEMKAKATRLYTAEWVVWPPAQVFNFYILPTRFRVLYDNTISLGYDVYTSYVAHDEVDEKDEEEDNSKDSASTAKVSKISEEENEELKAIGLC